MPKYIEIEAWILVDGDENYAVSHDSESVTERYLEDVSDDNAVPRRTICVKLRVPVPEVVELSATIPEEPADAELKIA